MARLTLVSNRTSAGQQRAGGLAIAVWEALMARGGGLWFGWSGDIAAEPTRGLRIYTEEGIDFALADLDEEEYAGYYLGFANRALWPVCHYRLDLAHFSEEDFDTYSQVNRRFARLLSRRLGDDDVVWVHDYHFYLFADYLRQEGWEGRIGFFHHIPFPVADIFRAIPQHHRLAKGLTQYDLIGFQAERDVTNFERYLIEECDGKRTGDGRIAVFGREVRVGAFPIGIDAHDFASLAVSPQAQMAADRIGRFLMDRALIIGVDRMDYSKGLPERFRAFGRMIETYPDVSGQVSFTQIVPPSRTQVEEYMDLRNQLDQLTGHLNGDYGDLDWIPIRYLANSYPRAELAGLYRLARVGLVTPLYDGMNLVAKEYVAAQDPENPGVLVLSEFAGAAEQLHSALIVNPHDENGLAEAIKMALEMPLEERQRRWQDMWSVLEARNIEWWYNSFLSVLNEFCGAENEHSGKSPVSLAASKRMTK